MYLATLSRGDFESSEQLLPALGQVCIGKLQGNDFVLLGFEDLSHRKVSAVYPRHSGAKVNVERSSSAQPLGTRERGRNGVPT